MNTPAEQVEKTAEHEGLIKTPKQLITTIILAFIIPITVILLLIRLVTASTPLGSGSDAHSQEAVAKRIQPVAGFALVVADTESGAKTGEQVFASTCSACHTAGVAGAPRVGDTAAWAPIIAKGYDTILNNALNGINAMPARGGNPSLSDLEVARAVVHMTNQSGANFPEPQEESEGKSESASTASAPAAEAAPAPVAAAPAAEPQKAADSGKPPADDKAPAAAESAAGAAAGNIDLAAGEKLYKSACLACHQFGVAGAPKTGDKAAWDTRLAAGGIEQLIKTSIEGKGAMPPRGGSTANDETVAAAVYYMIEQVK